MNERSTGGPERTGPPAFKNATDFFSKKLAVCQRCSYVRADTQPAPVATSSTLFGKQLGFDILKGFEFEGIS